MQIDKRYKKGSTVIREAWKCFIVQGGYLKFCYRGGSVTRGEWLKAYSSFVTMGDPPWPHDAKNWHRDLSYPRKTYEAGFHVFADKETAMKYGIGTVTRVFVQGIRLVGKEYGAYVSDPPIGPVLVADEMFVP
jgi:hypothetical protein